jgi:hypothetical protein
MTQGKKQFQLPEIKSWEDIRLPSEDNTSVSTEEELVRLINDICLTIRSHSRSIGLINDTNIAQSKRITLLDVDIKKIRDENLRAYRINLYLWVSSFVISVILLFVLMLK